MCDSKIPTIQTCDKLHIKESSIHGMGGFAKEFIPKNSRIIEYTGRRISKKESLDNCIQNNAYIFYLNEEFDLDGNVEWNIARFLNHSCDPNAEARFEDGHIWIVAIRDITRDEEITFDYGYDLESYRDYPCQCGAPSCCGYMIAAELRPPSQKPS